MKRRTAATWLAAFLAGTVFLAGFGQTVAAESLTTDTQARRGVTAGETKDSAVVAKASGALTEISAPLSAAEAEDLAFMREEGKVARDVYAALYAQWGLPLFQNIGASEQRHMDAVAALMDRYDVDDLAAGLAAGEFANPDLQALYDQLVEQGSESLEDALRVGAAIEEIDILDLEERDARTERADVARVYGNLLSGSRNHLRAFVSMLESRFGVTYAPQYVTADAYQEIVDAGVVRGRGRL